MLKQNILDYNYPEEPVGMYFSTKRGFAPLKSITLIPNEVKEHEKFKRYLSKSNPDRTIYTCYDFAVDDAVRIEINFRNPDNEDFVKAYYRWKLLGYFRQPQFDEVIITNDGVTNDLQLWIKDESAVVETVNYLEKPIQIKQYDRFTLKVRYDHLNHHPYLLVACSSPAKLLEYSLLEIFSNIPIQQDPFTDTESSNSYITPAHINRIKICKTDIKENYCENRIEKLTTLQKKNKYFDYATSYPVLGRELKRFFHFDEKPPARNNGSKYESYFLKISAFKEQYLQGKELRSIFPNLSNDFVTVNPTQVDKVDESKRMLVFGKGHRDIRQQSGINHGPYRQVSSTNVQLIFIYHTSYKDTAREILKKFINYDKLLDAKSLSHYIGTPCVNFAHADLHIEFNNAVNPLPEIKAKLQNENYRNLDLGIKYVGIYVSSINKYSSEELERQCYFKIKEAFLNKGIPTQCMEARKIKNILERGNNGLLYTLQNMCVAICAKLGGAPWLLAEPKKNELIIGIGAFKSHNMKYIGTAFTFDNMGSFNSYQYFQKDQIDELTGAIQLAIIKYASLNKRLDRLIIHYYKPMNLKTEFEPIDKMLSMLGLDIPVYVVTINKTEANDIVLFDMNSTYTDFSRETKMSYMPYSGTYVNMGKNRQGGNTFILCNNTRYEGVPFKSTDGFPFPVKLKIHCPNREGEIERTLVSELIGQVYQFSRIYYKSVKQQGLPVTIQYPSMIAEIMPHFDESVVNVGNESLWFL